VRRRARSWGTSSRTRLVTLTGAPGCGKSRLGLELGSRLTSRFRDGVWLTELAPLADPALTAGAVGMALGVGEQPGGPMAATLADALAGRELLLILDNCEQVVEAVAELAGHLIGRCPSVRILATTRVPLGLPGEQVWTLPPLTPEPAVELFIDRARLVSREFPVDDAGRSAIEQICRRLDGLPLAIELAAASTRVLSAGQIADRLEQELDLPGRGAPTASPWRRTMPPGRGRVGGRPCRGADRPRRRRGPARDRRRGRGARWPRDGRVLGQAGGHGGGGS
jgi:predicted ATPase